MKKMFKIITVINIFVMMSLCFCMNVNAATKITPTLSANNGCAAYYIESGIAYNLYQDAKATAYYVLDGKKPSVWNDTTKFQQIIIKRNNEDPQGMFIYDFKEETLVKSAKVFTVTEAKSGVGWATQAVLCYSDDNEIFTMLSDWQSFENGEVEISTNNEEKHRYWGIRAKSTTGQEYMSITEFELYDVELNPTTGGTGGSGTGGITAGEEVKREEIDGFFEKAINQLDKDLKNNMFYAEIIEIINQIKAIFEEDYSRGQEGLDELGVFNMTLRQPHVTISKDFGNEIIGSWEQSYNKYTSNIDYGINNVRTMNLEWFFGKEYSDGYYRKGVKVYTDALIGGFLWLMFVIYLWRNLPNLIAGEIGQITKLTTEKESIETGEMKTVEWDVDKKRRKETITITEKMKRGNKTTIKQSTEIKKSKEK